jgi:hypothetical protein
MTATPKVEVVVAAVLRWPAIVARDTVGNTEEEPVVAALR